MTRHGRKGCVSLPWEPPQRGDGYIAATRGSALASKYAMENAFPDTPKATMKNAKIPP